MAGDIRPAPAGPRVVGVRAFRARQAANRARRCAAEDRVRIGRPDRLARAMAWAEALYPARDQAACHKPQPAIMPRVTGMSQVNITPLIGPWGVIGPFSRDLAVR